MARVQDLMTTAVVTVGPQTSFKQLVGVLLDNDVSGVPVVDREDRLVGIVTEADLLPKEAFGTGERRRVLRIVAELLAGDAPSLLAQAEGRTAADLMTERVSVANPEEDARHAAQRMLEHGVKRLPVVEGERLVGIVSRSDLLRAFTRDEPDEALAFRS